MDDFWAPRDCFLKPPQSLHHAADLLDAAVDAMANGDKGNAAALVVQADDPEIWEYASQLMGPANQNVLRYREMRGAPPYDRSKASRMPTVGETKSTFVRDGWRCRICGVRTIYPAAVAKLRKLFPSEARWGRRNTDQHRALLVLKASLDHVLPHSRGGDNNPENLLTACYPCQFGRGSWTLDEVGIIDPRLRAPVHDGWDGLTRLLVLPTE